MYRIEIIDKDEFLQAEENYRNKSDMMKAYKKIVNSVNIRYKLHGLIIQCFEGQNIENLRELKKYRVEF